MAIRSWSGDFRLVARFADAAAAAMAAHELRAFFDVHAEQMDAAMVIEEGTFPVRAIEHSQAACDLAERHGFTWDAPLVWGDRELLAGYEPDVGTVDEVLAIYHRECGGFGTGIPSYLAALGATLVEHELGRAPTLSVLMQPIPSGELDNELATVCRTRPEIEVLTTPWPTSWPCPGRSAHFRQADTIGLYFPTAPRDIANLRVWLSRRSVRSAIQLCAYEDEYRFAAVARARCRSCGGPVTYLDPRLHDIETPQLLCTPCGGFYEVETFSAPDV